MAVFGLWEAGIRISDKHTGICSRNGLPSLVTDDSALPVIAVDCKDGSSCSLLLLRSVLPHLLAFNIFRKLRMAYCRFQLHVPVPSRCFVFSEASTLVGEQQRLVQDWLMGLRVSPCVRINRKEAIEESKRGKSIFNLWRYESRSFFHRPIPLTTAEECILSAGFS